MSILALSQSQRADLSYIRPIYIVDWVIEDVTLRIADQDWRYKYSSSQLLYESYLLGVGGIGEVLSSDTNPVNSNVLVEIANQPWSTYDKLSKLNAAKPFRGSTLYLYEIRRFFTAETFATDIRNDCLVGIYSVEQLVEYDEKSLKIRCSSRIHNKRNYGFDRVTRSTYPYCAPEEDGKLRNIGYGEIEGVPCSCVKTGAIDLLSAYITDSQTTLVVQGIARFAFEAGGTIQVDDEVIPYTTFTPSTNTFSGCIRLNGQSHNVDAPVMQLVSAFVYEAFKHPIRSFSSVSVDDYDVTDKSSLESGTDLACYTGQSSFEYSGYSARAVVVVPVDITKPLRKLINKTKDTHSHTSTSETLIFPTTFRDGTAATVLFDNNWSTYKTSLSNFWNIINFHDASYVENAHAIDFHTIKLRILVSKATAVVDPIKFYWIDRDPVTTPEITRLRAIGNCLTITIPPGNYTSPIWFEGTVPRSVQWRTGGVLVTFGASDTTLCVHEMRATYASPKGRTPNAGSGGSGTLANIWDGDDTTYCSLTQATAATRLIGLWDTPKNIWDTIERLDVYVLLDSNGLATTWDVGVYYDENSYPRSLSGTLLKGQVLSKSWYKFSFECDQLSSFENFIMNINGTIGIRLFNGSGTTTVRIYDMYWEFTTQSTISIYESIRAITADSIRGGIHTAQLVVGDEVTVTAETRADDASGTITGTANALITRPDHVIKHALVNLLGFSSTYIGASFVASSLEFISRSFAFNFLVNDISNDWQKVFSSLAYQCNCRFWEWAGKFELGWIPVSTPSADCTIEDEDIVFPSLPKFSEKPIWDCNNLLVCYSGRDYRTKKRLDDEFYRKLDPDSASRGFKNQRLVSSFGSADQQGEITLNAVTSQYMAQDLLDFAIARNQTQSKLLQLVINWRGRNITPSNFPEFTNDLVGTLTYKVEEYKLYLEKGVVEISLESV